MAEDVNYQVKKETFGYLIFELLNFTIAPVFIWGMVNNMMDNLADNMVDIMVENSLNKLMDKFLFRPTFL